MSLSIIVSVVVVCETLNRNVEICLMIFGMTCRIALHAHCFVRITGLIIDALVEKDHETVGVPDR